MLLFVHKKKTYFLRLVANANNSLNSRAVAEAWTAPDDTLAPLIQGYAHLAPRLLELAAMCDWAVERVAPDQARVRMSFLLETPEARTSRPAGY